MKTIERNVKEWWAGSSQLFVCLSKSEQSKRAREPPLPTPHLPEFTTWAEMQLMILKAPQNLRNIVGKNSFPSLFPIRIIIIVHPKNIFVSEKLQMFCALYSKETSHYFLLICTLKKHWGKQCFLVCGGTKDQIRQTLYCLYRGVHV